jgi:HEAT repeat protein
MVCLRQRFSRRFQKRVAENEARIQTIRDFADLGPEATEQLLPYLADPVIEVRTAAAEVLGQVGDRRAIQPLLAALRRSFSGDSGRRNRMMGFVAVGVFVLLIILFVIGSALIRGAAFGGLLNCILQPAIAHFRHRRQQSVFVKAATEALGAIAERHPDVELSTVVDDLRAVADDRLQQNPETREASRRTADRIEALVGDLRSLPVSADAPAWNGEGVLPRASTTPQPNPETLPLIRG